MCARWACFPGLALTTSNLAILPLNASIGVIKVLADPAVQLFASFATKKLVVTALFHNFLPVDTRALTLVLSCTTADLRTPEVKFPRSLVASAADAVRFASPERNTSSTTLGKQLRPSCSNGATAAQNTIPSLSNTTAQTSRNRPLHGSRLGRPG